MCVCCKLLQPLHRPPGLRFRPFVSPLTVCSQPAINFTQEVSHMNEEWREVKEFPDYEVSNLGRVRRVIYKKFYLNDWDYPVIDICTGGRRGRKKKQLTIHRLVALAFIDNPDNLPEVNHKDGNKMNFAADNLEWMTRLENRRHAMRTGLHVVG